MEENRKTESVESGAAGKRRLTETLTEAFRQQLLREEKSENTVAKYLRDVRAFAAFAKEREVSKDLAIGWKTYLKDRNYAVRSINSMLASLNSLFDFLGWNDCRVKAIRVQRQLFCPGEKELTKDEYRRLVNTARLKQNRRLCLLLQTVCGTGIRVSELKDVTAEAVRRGEATVTLKGKTRTVFFVKPLQKKLLRYLAEQRIVSGPVFITRSGKPMSRTNIWREMKALCSEAGVCPSKVFPHNLRHLFARCFYGLDKDLVRLADLLGHSSINTTRLYVISTGSEHKQRMEQMRLIL